MVRGAVALPAETLAGEVAPFGITVNKVLRGATETARLALIVEAKASRSSKLVEAMAE
jgi:3-oxoacyl-[acyl-carrier protein] reductase